MQEHVAVLRPGAWPARRYSPTLLADRHFREQQILGLHQGDTFKSPDSLLFVNFDIVSKNGNLLLNIGPRSDGTIPEGVQQVLLDIGAWLNANGEAIYGTRPWRIYGEGPTKIQVDLNDVTKYTAEDYRFTTRGDVLYAIGLAWPGNGEAVIRSLAKTLGSAPVQNIGLLGGDAKLRFDQQHDGLHVQLPSQPPFKYAYALRLTF